jgi:hypothetical protein
MARSVSPAVEAVASRLSISPTLTLMATIAEQTTDTRLKRGISGPLLYLFILGDVLGAGVYALVGVISAEVGGAIWMPLMVALALALLTAGSYAELVTKYPKAGGAAVFGRSRSPSSRSSWASACSRRA